MSDTKRTLIEDGTELKGTLTSNCPIVVMIASSTASRSAKIWSLENLRTRIPSSSRYADRRSSYRCATISKC